MRPLTLQFVIAMIASAINERMRRRLDYALEENRILKEAFRAVTGKERIPFTPDQRRRLALAGKELSPEERRQCCQIVKPATILAWFRQLAARKYDSSRRKTGRPRKARDIRKLVVNTLVYALNRQGGVRERVNDAALRNRLATSSIVVAELLYGAGRSSRPEENRKVVLRGIERFQIVPFTFATAEHFARLMTDLAARGKTPPRVDLMIAATALELGATLVTHDDDLLSARIPELTVVDWVTPRK